MRMIGPALSYGMAPVRFSGSVWERAAASAVENSPYLKRLIERRPDLIEDVDGSWPDRQVREAVLSARDLESRATTLAEGMWALRRAKDAVHLATAIADLAGAWPLARVTHVLTDFADAALSASLSLGVRELAARGELVPTSAGSERGPIPGFALIAMGKMGARELNYSSDIDFSVFFEPELLALAKAREPRVAAVRLVAPLVRALEEVTEDGYVFRTDLRLRPDPGSTPVAVSIASAEHYYQNLGQNWERAAFIKARAAAGDRACGQAFLASLEPFIWRKHLDFAAVEDVHSIKRQILSAHKSAELDDPVFDVKLGRGGIRDIELFAQTQQLILGGRNRKLRSSGTLAALDALADAGAIAGQARDTLHGAYLFFRGVEHRIQMLEDAQTHRIPADGAVRARVAALSGFESLEEFDAALVENRRAVADVDRQLFGRGDSLADPLGSLIFTGVEDSSETLVTISRLGFANPALVSQTIRGWHHGRIRAMRSERARELLTRLTPRLLRALAGAGDADHAFSRFSSFFSGLNAGVQLLSLLDARPALLDLLARLLTLAPRLADTLTHTPALLDALIEPAFLVPLAQDAAGARAAALHGRLADEDTFEARLNAARRFRREEAFRIDVQVLEGIATAGDAGAAFADLADACVEVMANAALMEVERSLGPQPGAFAILGLGKLGGRELAEGSDLDLMMIYDAPADAASASEYYARVMQRLISALSAPTEEGLLYEIDTKLRPSGSKGPVAVRISSFERYYAEEAWTWELLALTRLRPVAGDQALAAGAMDIAKATLTRSREPSKVLADVADMRARMDRERAARGVWDLKLAPGGFVDVEFIAQALQLVAAHGNPAILSPNTGDALQKLTREGVVDERAGGELTAAWRTLTDLNQILRISVEDANPDLWPAPFKARLAAALGAASFVKLEKALRSVQAGVRAHFVRLLGPVSEGKGAGR
jgi:glutamate-ammonia-ligase adenylyltransferase